MDKRLLRTQFAARAATLADQFQHAVEKYPVGKHRGEMTAPEASTGGGVQSLQHIRLVPPAGHGKIYVVGNANRLQRAAELRTLEYVDNVSLERFDELTGFDPAAYRAFLDVAQQFLEMFGLSVTRLAIPNRPASIRPPSPKKSSAGAMFFLAILLLATGIGVGLLVGIFRHH